MSLQKQEVYLQDWKTHEACAERMLPIIGRMYRENNVVPIVYGRTLVHCSVIDILKAHRFARLIIDTELSVTDTLPLLEAMSKLDLAPARVDLGKLIVKYQSMDGSITVDDFVRRKLATINTGRGALRPEPQDIVLYGFGRIGRLVARILVEKAGSGEKRRLFAKEVLTI